MSTVISIEDVSKLYRLGEIGTGSLAHDVNRWWHKVRGKEDPYLQVGVANDRTSKGDSDYVYAIQDVSFEVKQGEVLGIIGRNGAGKSTLLKILSRVTTPTSGQIKVKGRIASLLEVGTGFHPELTGRENIFLNGAILGMRKDEIRSKFDEIVDFSGCERYIDTPVKRYSSGMYVRLAFAVAAHLEPEILIVDEVLAVGDAEFQKKCLGKMKDVAGQGRTVIFVSHNMGAVASLCNSAVRMKQGRFVAKGPTQQIINSYVGEDSSRERSGRVDFKPNESKDAQILGIGVLNSSGTPSSSISHDEDWFIEMSLIVRNSVPDLVLGIRLTDQMDVRIGTIQFKLIDLAGIATSQNTTQLTFKVKGNQISPRQLSLGVALHIPNIAFVDQVDIGNIIEIYDAGSEFSAYGKDDGGVVFLDYELVR
jgi:lipopolysaccharide transport system ATP-binding protein